MSYIDDFRDLQIQLEDVMKATNDFKNRPIGLGGFGAVYKGDLLLQEGWRTVAIKRLDRKFGQGDVEFWKEITLLSEFKHINLASLLHFCSEGKERILIYEYASRQSLDRYLDKASLTWTQRLHICLGAARAIAYLHDPKETKHRVVHRDIKSSNILLDDEWTAKVSDFGLSKITPANQARTYVVSNIAGTPGYCDPVYYDTGILSKECDVYSFGVVLFEVMCGRLCCEFDKGKLISILVRTWKNRYDEDRLDEIILSGLKNEIDQDSLSTFATVAKRCLNGDNRQRPNMAEVVKQLEVALHYQQNPKKHEARVSKTPTSSYRFLRIIDHLKVPLVDIKMATENFLDSYLINRGEFGYVYHGELSLPGGRRIKVLIKRLDPSLGHGKPEFSKEIFLLLQFKHLNLVSLLGFCNEDEEMILVYDYASRGSLDRYLSDPAVSWTQRLDICLGVANAINYLHDSIDPDKCVIHGGIKSSIILLDEDWTPRVSYFGQSKFYRDIKQQTDSSFGAVGKTGFSDMLSLESGNLTKQYDVYSVGVVLLELICCKSSTWYHDGELALLVPAWIRSFEEHKLHEIIPPNIKKKMVWSSFETLSSIAYRCLKSTQEEGPTMSEVVKEVVMAREQQGWEELEETACEYSEETRSSQKLAISPISNTSENQNFLEFPDGDLVGDGNTWVSKLINGKVREVISATKCISADSLVHDGTQKSRFTTVIQGRMHNGFTVKATTQFLSPKVTYDVSLVFKHNGTDHGTHIPFKFELKLDEERYYSNSCMTHVRDDGWLMIELHHFTSYKGEYDLEIQFLPLFDITSSSIEYILEGIEFRPALYVSM